MNPSTSMGPVGFAGLTYLICAIISLAVAGLISIIFGIIKLQRGKEAVKVAAAQSAKK